MLTVWMQDKDGLGEAMGRQDLALLHFTKFVSLLPRSLGSVRSEQAAKPGDPSHHPARRPCTARTCACSLRVWVSLPCLEGPALDGRGN